MRGLVLALSRACVQAGEVLVAERKQGLTAELLDPLRSGLVWLGRPPRLAEVRGLSPSDVGFVDEPPPLGGIRMAPAAPSWPGVVARATPGGDDAGVSGVSRASRLGRGRDEGRANPLEPFDALVERLDLNVGELVAEQLEAA